MKIGIWNVEGLCRNLKNSIDVKIKLCDLFACVETWHTVQSNINVSGYQHFSLPATKHRQKGRPSGGVVVYFKKEMLNALTKFKSSLPDTMWIRLKGEYIDESFDTYICVTYIKTGKLSPTTTYPCKLQNEIERFSALGKIMLLGDCNARTGYLDDFMTECDNDVNFIPLPVNYSSDRMMKRNNLDKVVTTNGRSLINICKTSGLRILNGRVPGDFLGAFTCITPRGSSLVDYCIASDSLVQKVISLSVGLHTEYSQHCPIIINLNLKLNIDINVTKHPVRNLQPHKKRYIWTDNCVDPYCISILSSPIQDKLVDFTTNNYGVSKMSANKATSDLSQIILLAADSTLKVRHGKNKHKRSRNKAWFNNDCKEMKCELMRLAKLLKRSPYDKRIHNLYMAKRKQFKQLCNQQKRKVKDNILTSLSSLQKNDPKSFWSLLSRLSDDTKDKDDSDTFVSHDEWYDYFKSLSVKPPHVMPPDMFTEFTELENKATKTTANVLNKFITMSEVKAAVKRIKNNKAPGDDCILPEMIKYSCPILLNALTKLFNIVLASKTFPDPWNVALQSPLHKGGDPTCTDNYRGISLMSCLGKCFTSILSERLYEFVNSTGKLSKEQCAFRKGYRTSDNIFCLQSIINKYVNNSKKKLFACFVDFRKAFDCVWRDAMFLKLLKLGVDGNYYDTIKSMYSSTSAKVKLNEGTTETFYPNVGIRQGDCLSPLLFNLFIDDIKEYIHDCDPVEVGDARISHLLFADDLLLLSETESGLQKQLTSLSTYCDKWKLGVNLKKTKIVTFQKRAQKIGGTQFKFGDTIIENSDSYTYLGITFKYNGMFQLASTNLKNKSTKAMFKMLSLLSSTTNLDIHMLSKLFDCMIKPIATYGAEIWAVPYLLKLLKHNDVESLYKHIDKIPYEHVHNTFCKRILGVYKSTSNKNCRKETGRYSLSIPVTMLVIKYWLHIIKLDSSRVAFQAYLSEKSIDAQSKESWVTFVKTLLYECDMKHIWDSQYVHNEKVLLSNIKEKLIDIYGANVIASPQNYLQHKIQVKYRKAISRLRLRSNRLQIVRGRYSKIPECERTCRFCVTEHVIENEMHFMLSCPKHKTRRKELLSKMTDLHFSFDLLNDDEKLDILLNPNVESMSRVVGKYIYDSFLEY